jgi:hypothetical protein
VAAALDRELGVRRVNGGQSASATSGLGAHQPVTIRQMNVARG